MRGILFALIVPATVAGVTAAWSAQDCLEQARALAGTYALSIDPPGGRPGDPPSSGELGRSGGVVEPPRTRDPAVIKPEPDGRSGMPTLPDVTPKTPQPDGAAARALGPSDRAALEAILIAARDHALRGREDACLERLRKAAEFIDRARQ